MVANLGPMASILDFEGSVVSSECPWRCNAGICEMNNACFDLSWLRSVKRNLNVFLVAVGLRQLSNRLESDISVNTSERN